MGVNYRIAVDGTGLHLTALFRLYSLFISTVLNSISSCLFVAFFYHYHQQYWFFD
jgi:hypothetical protein